VRVLAGEIAPSEADRRLLTPEEVAAGWRLACHARATADATVDVAQWDSPILADDRAFEFTPRDGFGIAVDVGTTTLVAQLVDLANGHVPAVQTALNPQAVYGADVMTRIEYAVRGGAPELARLVRGRIGEMVGELTPPGAPVSRITLAGNTVMHHLFCGLDVEPLAHVPFEPENDGLVEFDARELGWTSGARVSFLPCLGGFVGSDILAGVIAADIHRSDALVGLIDLGTNGEILFGNRERIICASAAAGPAFEGGRISSGMRAATGAISEVSLEGGALRCRVLGGGEARGICGSGLVDAVAAALALGAVQANGRLSNGTFPLAGTVALTQRDIRELQLAKAAVAAGVRIVLERIGASGADVARVYLAGAFGNYINRESARRIGLFSFPEEKIESAGNTALLGAKMALFSDDLTYAAVRARVEHIGLASDPRFQEIFVDEMAFLE